MSNHQDTHRIHRHTLQDRFSVLPNQLWEYEYLSWGAKGLMGYLLSRPKDWVIYRGQLSKIYEGEKRGNGKDAIDGFFNELIECGYIVYTPKDEKTGKFVHRYDVYTEKQEPPALEKTEEIQKKIPKRVKPATGLTSQGLNHPQQSNDCIQSNEENNNADDVSPEKPVLYECLEDLPFDPAFKKGIPWKKKGDGSYYAEKEIQKAVDVVKKCEYHNLEAFFTDVLQNPLKYKKKQRADSYHGENKIYAQKLLKCVPDGKFDMFRVEVLNRHVEIFVDGGMKVHVFEYSKGNFKQKLLDYLKTNIPKLFEQLTSSIR